MVFENIKLITFDLDDTLWPCMPVILRAERVLYEWLQQQAPRLTDKHSIESIREHRVLLGQARPHIAHNLTLTRELSLAELLHEHKHDPSLAPEAVTIFRKARNEVEPYAEVTTVLKSLREDYHLIAASNGNAEITETPLDGYFHHALNAELVGSAKPDPAMFHEAMILADASPNETLHIGDDPETDVMAAHNAGVKVIWMNRERKNWDERYPSAHDEIEHLAQLTERLP